MTPIAEEYCAGKLDRSDLIPERNKRLVDWPGLVFRTSSCRQRRATKKRPAAAMEEPSAGTTTKPATELGSDSAVEEDMNSSGNGSDTTLNLS